jgi:hypothetical protein
MWINIQPLNEMKERSKEENHSETGFLKKR